ncbi:MAG: hypothetical protein DF221_10395 [Brevibacillus sp.]|nr:MAG: hypothetical protein DF221_10395 [Brevibacillus sp.]
MYPFSIAHVTLNNLTMQLITHLDDKVAGAGFCSGNRLWSDSLEHARSLLKPKCRVLYAGGHLGSAAIYLAKAEPSATIYCFEPDPLNFALLTVNLHLNQVQNIHAFPYALGKSGQYISFFKSAWDSSDHRCAMPKSSDMEVSIFRSLPYKIQMVNPVEMFSNCYGFTVPPLMDLIVIDTQGADFAIIEACLPLVSKDTTIIAEYSPYHLYRYGTTREDAARVLKHFSRISLSREQPATVQQLLAIYDDYYAQYKGFYDICLRK